MEIIPTNTEHLFLDNQNQKKIKPQNSKVKTTKTLLTQPMFLSTETNKMTKVSTTYLAHKTDLITDTAEITVDELFTAFLKEYKISKGFRLSTSKLLTILILEFTRQNPCKCEDHALKLNVIIPIDKYMELKGIPNTKPSRDKARRDLQKDTKALYNLSLEWTNGKDKTPKNLRPFPSCYVGQKGQIVSEFSVTFGTMLVKAPITFFPLQLLSIKDTKPSAYYIQFALFKHWNILNNQKNGTHNIISVKCLLKECPSIPKYEAVMAGDRAITRKIITPFENALDESDFIKWEYCNSKKTPLTEQQLSKFNYQIWIKLYIHFEIIKEIKSIFPTKKQVQSLPPPHKN